jgi:hypothetical protein
MVKDCTLLAATASRRSEARKLNRAMIVAVFGNVEEFESSLLDL